MALINLFKRSSFCVSTRCFSSSLYITGDKAIDTCAILTPNVDFEKKFADLDILKRNIKLRGLSCNVDDLHETWKLFRDLDHTKVKLEQERQVILEHIKKLKDQPANETALKRLYNHGKMVRDDLKMLKDNLWPVEDSVMTKCLGLPNIIHDLTPEHEETVLFQHSEGTKSKSRHHFDIGSALNLVKYFDPKYYYLTGKAAVFELSAVDFFNDTLCDHNYAPFSNPDFSRSVVVEGCGLDKDNSDKVFTIEELHESPNNLNKLHLTGGSALTSFMAFNTKQLLYQSSFPLKYFTSGRQYTASTGKDLFSVSQATCIQTFSATTDFVSCSEQFSNLIDLCKITYKNIGYPFRIVYLPANKLKVSESLCASIQVFSNHLQQFIEVGNVSMYDTYLSERLLFSYRDGKKFMFPYVMSGTLVNITKLLACALEQSDTEFTLPKAFEKYY